VKTKANAHLYRAKEMGHVLMMERAAKACRRARQRYRPPLVEALYNGNLEVAEYLLSFGTPVTHTWLSPAAPSPFPSPQPDTQGEDVGRPHLLGEPLTLFDVAELEKGWRGVENEWRHGSGWLPPGGVVVGDSHANEERYDVEGETQPVVVEGPRSKCVQLMLRLAERKRTLDEERADRIYQKVLVCVCLDLRVAFSCQTKHQLLMNLVCVNWLHTNNEFAQVHKMERVRVERRLATNLASAIHSDAFNRVVELLDEGALIDMETEKGVLLFVLGVAAGSVLQFCTCSFLNLQCLTYLTYHSPIIQCPQRVDTAESGSRHQRLGSK
jgi:hypothetical protein